MTDGAFTNVLMLPPQDETPPTAAVLLLHGVGSNGEDLLGLAPFWAKDMPHVAFISPDAPFNYDMAPMGFQWFSLRDRVESRIVEEVKISAKLLDELIDTIMERLSIPADRVVLVGFSQGTMMALHVGLRREHGIGGVIGYAGRLINPGALPAEIKVKPPVLLVHGDADPVVPFDSLALAKAALDANGVEAKTLACPGVGHSIDEAGLDAGLAFLKEVLPG
ncbi:alpha/beta hydrolase [Lacibacterium aquatile]|uniref:Alpha/beta hydrolase n=1 Tax=Lacibacterium aquatile TaxID=1168082 RepID=A0ABW5DLV0_9PROT